MGNGGGMLKPKGASNASKKDAIVATIRVLGHARVAEPSGCKNGNWSVIRFG